MPSLYLDLNNKVSLNEFEETVALIESILATKANLNTASTTANGLLSKEDKTKLNGIANNANNYIHPTTDGFKHIPSGGVAGQILTWSANGTAKWANHGVPNASHVESGLLSNADKIKLDGIAANANNYVHPSTDGFLHVPATGSSNANKFLMAGPAAGSLIWKSLPSVVLSGSYNDLTDKPSVATSLNSGFMTSEDKNKLDNIAANANNYVHPTTSGNAHIPSGGAPGSFLEYHYDGYAKWTALTPSVINAAEKDHTHDSYLSLTGKAYDTTRVAGYTVTIDKAAKTIRFTS